MLTSAGDDSSCLRGLSPRPYVYGPRALPTELRRLPACVQTEEPPLPSYLAPRAGALATGTDTTTRAMMCSLASGCRQEGDIHDAPTVPVMTAAPCGD